MALLSPKLFEVKANDGDTEDTERRLCFHLLYNMQGVLLVLMRNLIYPDKNSVFVVEIGKFMMDEN